MCLGRLERIVGSLKSIYAAEVLGCVFLDLVNASEVSDNQEDFSRELS